MVIQAMLVKSGKMSNYTDKKILTNNSIGCIVIHIKQGMNGYGE